MTITGVGPTATTSQDDLDSLLREIAPPRGAPPPPQGAWSDEEYLALTDGCNRLIEFTDGCVQQLPMPTFTHQAVLLALYRSLHDYAAPRGGVAMVAGLRMRIREGKFREPDVLLLRDRSDPRCQDRYWSGADLAVEVVSPDDPARDLVRRRRHGLVRRAGSPGQVTASNDARSRDSALISTPIRCTARPGARYLSA